MEATSANAGTRDSGLKALLPEATAPMKDRAERILGRLKLDRPVRWQEAEEFLQKLYRVANSPEQGYPSLPVWLARRLPTPPREYLRRRLQMEIWRQDLSGALQALGFVGDPQMGDELLGWFRTHPNLTELVYSGGIDLFSWRLLGMPVHVPRAQATETLKIPPDLLALAREKGFDAVYPELRARFGRYATFDTAWNTGRAAVYRGGVVVLLYALSAYLRDHGYVLDPRYWRFVTHYEHISDQELQRLQDATFDADKVRRDQFLSFKKAYEETEGPFSSELPNPWDPDYAQKVQDFPPEYRSEADRTWKTLLDMAPDELKVQFGPRPAAGPGVSTAH
jgi:hypothetical protein